MAERIMKLDNSVGCKPEKGETSIRKSNKNKIEKISSKKKVSTVGFESDK